MMSDLPPQQPRDLRNRGQQDDDDNQNNPWQAQNSQYPPQGQQPQGGYGQDPLADPRQQGQAGNWQQPQGGYGQDPLADPRQQGQAGNWQQPQSGYGQDPLADPRQQGQAGNWQQPQGGGFNQPQQTHPPMYPPPGQTQLPPAPPPSLGGRSPSESYRPEGFSEDMDRLPAKRLGDREDNLKRELFREHRIEYMAWGSVVLLLGCGIIMLTIDTSFAGNFLRLGVPLMSGLILLSSSFLQRIVFSYRVTVFTWAMAILFTAIGLTQVLSMITDQGGILVQMTYFAGLLVITTGVVLILQVFSPSPN